MRRPGVLLLLVLGGCARSEPAKPDASSVTPPTLEDRARAVMQALVTRDAPALVAASARELRVEVKDLLVETDERTAEELTGEPAVAAFAKRFAGEWGTAGSRWPKGLSVAGELVCHPDCCDVRVKGVESGVVQLRRLCFAGRGPSGEPRLGYLVFATAR